MDNNYGGGYDDEYRGGHPREYDNDGGGGYYGGGGGRYPSRYYEFDERGFDRARCSGGVAVAGGGGGAGGRFVSRESLYEQAKRYTWDEEVSPRPHPTSCSSTQFPYTQLRVSSQSHWSLQLNHGRVSYVIHRLMC